MSVSEIPLDSLSFPEFFSFFLYGTKGGAEGWGCFLTKNFLLSDENIFTLPIDENGLEPSFLTKM